MVLMVGSNKQNNDGRAKKSRNLVPILFAVIILVTLVSAFAYLLQDVDMPLLNPKGNVAHEQHWLMITSTLVMLGFGIPVILTMYFFTWKFREDNPNNKYNPDRNNNRAVLAFAWGGPILVVAVLASLMLPATQRLVPQKPIVAEKPQLTVQVVSLNWKWVFIYPEQNIATVNFVQIPVDTPVRFELTADNAPMSSFWIPHLAGMLYTMTGHVNPLHLMADTIGDYPGASAEINGVGFAGMKFTTRVSTQAEFDAWIAEVKNKPTQLGLTEYEQLLAPSEYDEPVFFSSVSPNLFESIVGKYNTDEHHVGNHEQHRSY